jgi:hypothetical protein
MKLTREERIKAVLEETLAQIVVMVEMEADNEAITFYNNTQLQAIMLIAQEGE